MLGPFLFNASHLEVPSWDLDEAEQRLIGKAPRAGMPVGLGECRLFTLRCHRIANGCSLKGNDAIAEILSLGGIRPPGKRVQNPIVWPDCDLPIGDLADQQIL